MMNAKIQLQSIKARTFKIERITIIIFSFCIGAVTQLNGPALEVLKHYYIAKRIGKPPIGNSRSLIHNSLNQSLHSLYYTESCIKESCLPVTEFVEALDLNN